MSEWYYAIGGAQHGPVSTDQIAALVRSRTIDGSTLVWSASMTEWQPLSQTELASTLNASSPGAGVAPRPGGPFGTPNAQPGPAAGYGAPGYGAPAPAGAPPVTGFGEAVRAFWQNYAVFEGRANRPEFWYAVLFMFLAGIVAGFADLAIVGTDATFQPVSSLVSLALLIPSISVGVRRLHDTDRSGWFYLLLFLPLIGLIALIVFWCQRGTPGTNRFG
jgi:uncharacterized membrane protein YhaH (DUF805 family)